MPGKKDEEEFHRALRRADVSGTLREWVPMLAAAVVVIVTFLLILEFWPLDVIPILLLLGVPVAAGVGALVLLRKIV